MVGKGAIMQILAYGIQVIGGRRDRARSDNNS